MSLISPPSSCLVSENGLILHLIFSKPSVIDKSLVSILHFLFYTFTSMLGLHGRQCVPLNPLILSIIMWLALANGMSADRIWAEAWNMPAQLKLQLVLLPLAMKRTFSGLLLDNRAYLCLASLLKINAYFICHCTWAMVFIEAWF